MNLADELDHLHVIDFVKQATGAEQVDIQECVQSLWSGYGEIRRFRVVPQHAKPFSVIVKNVRVSSMPDHPRGWSTQASHQRKLRSYQIENHWYQHYAAGCGSSCRVAHCYAHAADSGSMLLLLEDLDYKFPLRVSSADVNHVQSVLKWLANFHARFMGSDAEGLWPVGSYWHLDTRADELLAMPEGQLKDAAGWLDQQLKQCRYQSLVHGDAKIANFCFSSSGGSVAAVDFQYVGRGIGIRDVAYFLGSCLSEQQLCEFDDVYLDYYFEALVKALTVKQPALDALQVADEWRSLYAVAWTDFYRFLAGWMPDHPKVHSYTTKLAGQVLSIAL